MVAHRQFVVDTHLRGDFQRFEQVPHLLTQIMVVQIEGIIAVGRSPTLGIAIAQYRFENLVAQDKYWRQRVQPRCRRLITPALPRFSTSCLPRSFFKS